MSKGFQFLNKIVTVKICLVIIFFLLLHIFNLYSSERFSEYQNNELEYQNSQLVRQSERVFERVLKMNETLLTDFTTLLESNDPEMKEQAFVNIDLQWNISSIYYHFDSGNMYKIYPMRYEIFYGNLKGIKNKIKMKEDPTLTKEDRENLENAIHYLSIFTEGMKEISILRVRNREEWRNQGLVRFYNNDEVMEIIEEMHESISELPPLLR